MAKNYRIELDDSELGQIIDGLEVRATAWEMTAEYHRTGEPLANFIVEECNGADEAGRIAAQYRSTISKIQNQRESQI